jgi:uncharacterized protein
VSRATVDVNVLLSGLINPRGAPHAVLQAWADQRFVHVTSEHIILTLAAKLATPDIARRFPALPAVAQQTLILLRTQAVVAPVPIDEVVPITGDPEDDAVLATARLGQADYLVTADRALLALASHGSTRILTPRDFLAVLDRDRPSASAPSVT